MKAPLSPFRWVGPQLHTSGVVAVVDGAVTSDDFAEQTASVLAGLDGILRQNGLTVDDVVSVSAYLSSMDHFAEFNAMYAEFFREPYPVRTTIACELFPGVQVEISLIAQRSGVEAG